MPDKGSLAFDQLIRLLDRQVAVLSDVRTRASFIFTANGAVAALLAQAAFQVPKKFAPLGLVLAAIGAAVSLAACLMVYRSVGDVGKMDDVRSDGKGKRRWLVTVGYEDLRRLLDNARIVDDAAMKAEIFRDMHEVPSSNFATIGRLNWWLKWAVAGLVFQGIGWTIAAVVG
jgi:hypothetical protein